MRRVAVAVAIVMGLVNTACRHTAAPKAEPVKAVVAGPVSAYREIALVAGTRRAALTATDAAPLAPLLAGRTVAAAEPLAHYGLDPPQARIEYTPVAGQAIVVEVGWTDFDHHFVYVVRPPDRATIDLVPTTTLAPLLQQIGVELPPPG